MEHHPYLIFAIIKLICRQLYIKKIQNSFSVEYTKQKRMTMDSTCEDDIKVDMSTSFDNSERKELLWENRQERLLLKWSDSCQKTALAHSKCGKKNKAYYRMIGIPSIVIPIVLGGLSPIVECNSLVNSLLLMVSGLVASVAMFFNFGKKYQEHYTFENKYNMLRNEMAVELSKPKSGRMACDVYLEKIKNNFNNLNSQAPDL